MSLSLSDHQKELRGGKRKFSTLPQTNPQSDAAGPLPHFRFSYATFHAIPTDLKENIEPGILTFRHAVSALLSTVIPSKPAQLVES